MIRRALWAAVLLFASAVFAGCSLSKEGVKLRSEKEVTEIAERDHGSVTFLREENETGRRTFYYRDDTYGFEFSIDSHASSQGMDGSAFYYEEALYDSWWESYGSYFADTAVSAINDRLSEQGGMIWVETSVRSHRDIIAELHIFGDFEELRSQICEVCAELKEADKAGALDSEIPVYKGGGDLYRLSVYHTDSGETDSPEDVRAESMFGYVEIVMQGDIERGEVKKIASPEDIPGLSAVGYLTDHSNEFCYPHEDIRMYCFTKDGEGYFIVNVVRADDMNYYIATEDGVPYDYY